MSVEPKKKSSADAEEANINTYKEEYGKNGIFGDNKQSKDNIAIDSLSIWSTLPWRCWQGQCRYSTSSIDEFKNHMKSIHGIHRKLWQCKYCPKRYEHKYQLLYHENIHLNNGRFECDKCSQRFAINSQLIRHKSICSINQQKIKHKKKKKKKKEKGRRKREKNRNIDDITFSEWIEKRRKEQKTKSMIKRRTKRRPRKRKRMNHDQNNDNGEILDEPLPKRIKIENMNNYDNDTLDEVISTKAIKIEDDNDNNDNCYVYKEKLELENIIKAHRKIEDMQDRNKNECILKMNELENKWNELNKIYQKMQKEINLEKQRLKYLEEQNCAISIGDTLKHINDRQLLLPIIQQIHERYLNSIDTLKMKMYTVGNIERNGNKNNHNNDNRNLLSFGAAPPKIWFCE